MTAVLMGIMTSVTRRDAHPAVVMKLGHPVLIVMAMELARVILVLLVISVIGVLRTITGFPPPDVSHVIVMQTAASSLDHVTPLVDSVPVEWACLEGGVTSVSLALWVRAGRSMATALTVFVTASQMIVGVTMGGTRPR